MKRSHRKFYPGISAFHHIDGDPTNDSLDNLILVNTRDHWEPDDDDEDLSCPICGDVMIEEDGALVCPDCGNVDPYDGEYEEEEDWG